MRYVTKPLIAALAGVVAGLLIVTPMWLHDKNQKKQPREAVTSNGATEAFITAYLRAQNTPFAATQKFERRSNDSVGVDERNTFIAVKPPQSVVRTANVYSSQSNTLQVDCTKQAKNWMCFRKQGSSWEESTKRLADQLDTYFHASPQIYAAAQLEGNCFRIDNLTGENADEWFGLGSRICFDSTTGVATSFIKTLPNGTDTLTLQDVREPQESDFFIPTNVRWVSE